MLVHDVEVDPAPHNVLGFEFNQASEIAELCSFEGTATRDSAEYNLDNLSFTQNDLRARLTTLELAMHVNRFVLFGIKVNHQPEIFIKFWHSSSVRTCGDLHIRGNACHLLRASVLIRSGSRDEFVFEFYDRALTR